MVLTDIKGLGEITTISKGCVSAVVDSLGAKVLALFVNDENILHYDEQDISHSGIPICLPSFGPLKEGVFTYNGQDYPMGQHGFIRDCELSKESSCSESVTYVFRATDQTKKQYPFDFKFSVSYSLLDKGLKVALDFCNESNSPIPLAPGIHPYFAVKNPEDVLLNTKSNFANNNINEYKAEPLGEAGFLETVEVGVVRLLKVKKNPDMHLIDHQLLKTDLYRGKQSPVHLQYDLQIFNRLAVWRKAADSEFICIEPAFIQNGINDAPLMIAAGQGLKTGIIIGVS